MQPRGRSSLAAAIDPPAAVRNRPASPATGEKRGGSVNVPGRRLEVGTARVAPVWITGAVMILAVAYVGRSAVMQSMSGMTVSMAPNVRRERVSFVGMLNSPLRFREAMSALHDVVISDLRFRPKDRSAYETYLK